VGYNLRPGPRQQARAGRVTPEQMSEVSGGRSALTVVCVLSFLRSAFCATQCPEGYLLHDDTCYCFAPQSQGDVLYSACASTCVAQGATTLCVEDATQNTWINSINQRAT
jgi:hypothetical protein